MRSIQHTLINEYKVVTFALLAPGLFASPRKSIKRITGNKNDRYNPTAVHHL